MATDVRRAILGMILLSCAACGKDKTAPPAAASVAPADRRDDTTVMFALRGEFLVAHVQAMLGFPRHRFDLFALTLLAFLKSSLKRRFVPIRPSGFAQHMAHASVARLRNRSATRATATRVLSRDDAYVCHQLASTFEPTEPADFGHQRSRADFRHAAQGLQSRDQLLQMRGSSLDRGIDGFFKPFDALFRALYLVQIIPRNLRPCDLSRSLHVTSSAYSSTD